MQANLHGFAVHSRWFSGSASILTYQIDELLGTKVRALYQRKKGRELFDLWTAFANTAVQPERVVRCFLQYIGQKERYLVVYPFANMVVCS